MICLPTLRVVQLSGEGMEGLDRLDPMEGMEGRMRLGTFAAVGSQMKMA